MATAHQREMRRRQLWAVLHDGRGPTGRAVQFLLVILILVSIAILPLEFLTAEPAYARVLFILEVVITALFTVEYILRIYSAPSRLGYIVSIYGLIDLIAIAPFYVHLIDTQFLRALRLIRLVRLLRLGEIRSVDVEEAQGFTFEGVGIIPEEERVEHVVSHHPIYLILGSIPPIMAISLGTITLMLFSNSEIAITVAVIFFVFALLFLWRTWLNYSFDLIYVTSRRLIFYDQHLLGRNTNQLNYSSITNVKPAYHGILSYILRFGSITVETAADQMGHFEFHMVRDHEKAAQAIMRNCIGARPKG